MTLTKFTEKFLEFIHRGPLLELRPPMTQLRDNIKNLNPDLQKAVRDMQKDVDPLYQDQYQLLLDRVIAHQAKREKESDALVDQFDKALQLLQTSGKTLVTREKVFQDSCKEISDKLEEQKNADLVFVGQLEKDFSHIGKAGTDIPHVFQDFKTQVDDSKTQKGAEFDAVITMVNDTIQARRNHSQKQQYFQNLYGLSQQPFEAQEAVWQQTVKPSGTTLGTGKPSFDEFAKTLKTSDFPKLTVAEGFDVHAQKNRASFTLNQGWKSIIAQGFMDSPSLKNFFGLSGIASNYCIGKTLGSLSAIVTGYGAPLGCKPHDKKLNLDITPDPNETSQERQAEGRTEAIKSFREQMIHLVTNHGYKPENLRFRYAGNDITGLFLNDMKFMNELGELYQKSALEMKQYENKVSTPTRHSK